MGKRMDRLNGLWRWMGVGILAGLAACGAAPAPTQTPAPSFTPVATLVDSPTPDSQALIATLTALAPTATPPATWTPSAGITLTATETPVVITIEPLTGQRIEPPIDITLPAGWETVGYDVMILEDMRELRPVPLAVWRGPVTGGMGTLVLLWGFPNFINTLPPDGSPAPMMLDPSSGELVFPPGATPVFDLWSDGLRLLRAAVLEEGCNISTDLRRPYTVGGREGTGTIFSAVDCPDPVTSPPTRGYFAGVREKDLNFIFYAYFEGAAVMDNQNLEAYYRASEETQAIIAGVRFRVPDTVTATPSAAGGAAPATLTPTAAAPLVTNTP
jgi:hypothetical protein